MIVVWIATTYVYYSEWVSISRGDFMINERELVILSHFRQDGRKPLTKISRETGIPISTLFEKLKQLQNNVILKPTALLNFNKIGFNVIVKILLKVNKSKKIDIGSYLVDHPNVNSIVSLSNNYDFFIETVFKNLKEFKHFTDRLEDFDILEKEDFFVIEDLKRESFMSVPEIVDLAK